LVNESGFAIHHVGNRARFLATAFIFDERGRRMVNRRCLPAASLRRRTSSRMNLALKNARYNIAIRDRGD
jgi:hypothetical protein